MRSMIDVHHHVVPPFYVEAMAEAGVRKVATRAFPKWSPERSLRLMDSVGIERAILSLSTPGVEPARDSAGLARRCNDYLATLRELRPDRFGAFGVIPFVDSDAAAGEAVYVLDELKLEGIALLSNGAGAYLDDPRFEELFLEIDRRGALVFIHPSDPIATGYGGLLSIFYGWFVDTSRTVALMEAAGVFDRYPNVTFVLSHGGGALPAIGEIVAKRSRLCCDTAKVAEPAPLDAILATFGPSRVLFGSDFPWADERKAPYWKSRIEASWGGDDELLDSVFRGNVGRLLSGAVKEESR